MYPQTLQPLYFLDGQRLLELHQLRRLMEKHRHACQNDDYEPIRRLAMVDHVRRSPGKPLTSFKISDILSGDDSVSSGSSKPNNSNQISSTDSNATKLFYERITVNLGNAQRDNSLRNIYHSIPNRTSPTTKSKIIRPWSRSPPLTSPSSDDGSEDSSRHSNNKILSFNILTSSPEIDRAHNLNDEEFIDVENCDDDIVDDSDSNPRPVGKDVSPLDALMAMSSKTFRGLEDFDKTRNGDQDNGKTNVPKKKRKTRTAFTNQQIYELEKRFIMQKYLTPADRDEISAKLGLSCAQVITWFQNRRAKFKRDIEEMKNDVTAGSPEDQSSKEKDVT